MKCTKEETNYNTSDAEINIFTVKGKEKKPNLNNIVLNIQVDIGCINFQEILCMHYST